MKAIMAALLALLLFNVSSVAFDAAYVTASPKTIRVPQDYQTIQEAINWASAGDTIMVAAGTYHENVVVHETVSIIGQDRNTTIIDGSGSEIEPVVRIEANNVSLSGFTIQNGYQGIWVFSSENSIVNNTVKDNRGEGILLFSHGNTLRHNNMEGNTYNFAVRGLWLFEFLRGPMPLIPWWTPRPNDVDTSNTVDGKPVYYWVNQHNKEIPVDAGYVAVINSTNITVRDLKLTKNGQGVLFAYTHNSTIKNVEVSSNMIGINLISSFNNIVSNNTITNNVYGIKADTRARGGISVVSFVGNKIISNTIINSSYCGITLWSSGHNVLKRNSMTSNRYSLDVQGYCDLDFIQDIDTSNTVDGKPVYYLVNQNDLIISPQAFPEIGYLGIVNSTNITIKDLAMEKGDGILLAYLRESVIEGVNTSNCFKGISLVSSQSNTINNNTMTNNEWGISLEASSNNMILNNVASNNEFSGIQLHESGGNNIVGNTISKNQFRGIELSSSSNNVICCNNFIDNTKQVQCYSSTNTWDNGYPSGGNYWSNYTGGDFYSGPYQNLTGSDGIGDNPYLVDKDNRDRYPLMNIKELGFVLLVSPLIQTINFGQSTAYEVTVIPIGGFTSDVLLSSSANPKTSEISLTFNPTTVAPLGNLILTVTTSASTPLQAFELTITGTGGGKTCMVKVKLAVEYKLEVPHQTQGNTNWCGPASLAMVLRYYGHYVHSWDVAGDMDLKRREGVTLKELYNYVRKRYPELTVQLGKYFSKSDQILYDVKGNVSLGYPVILLIEHGVRKHAVVVTGCNATGFFVSDPGGILPTWSGRSGLSEIHFFMTWDELYQFIYVVDTGTLLIVKGNPSPLSGTMHIDTYIEVRQTHPSDIYARHGETSQCTYLDLDRGLVWKDLESHNALDAQDNLTLTVHVSNHLPYEQHFTVAVSIVGEDQVTYFYNESFTLVASYSIRYIVNTWRISLKDYLTKNQNYEIWIMLMDSARNQVDFFATPPIYYSPEPKMKPEFPLVTIFIIATFIAAAVFYFVYRFRRKDGKYLLYIPKDLAEDSMFPFKAKPSVTVKVSFKVEDKKLTIEKWEEETDA